MSSAFHHVQRVRDEVQHGLDGVLLSTAGGLGEAEVEALLETDGAALDLALQGDYLLDALRAISTEQVSIENSGPSTPAVFRPTGGDSYVHVIMPMHAPK